MKKIKLLILIISCLFVSIFIVFFVNTKKNIYKNENIQNTIAESKLNKTEFNSIDKLYEKIKNFEWGFFNIDNKTNIDLKKWHQILNIGDEDVLITGILFEKNKKLVYATVQKNYIINGFEIEKNFFNTGFKENQSIFYGYKLYVVDLNNFDKELVFEKKDGNIKDGFEVFIPMYISNTGKNIIGLMSHLINTGGKDVGPRNMFSKLNVSSKKISNLIPFDFGDYIFSNDFKKAIYVFDSPDYISNGGACWPSAEGANNGAIFMIDVDTEKIEQIISSKNKYFYLEKIESNNLTYKEIDVKVNNNYGCWYYDENEKFKEKNIELKDFGNGFVE